MAELIIEFTLRLPCDIMNCFSTHHARPVVDICRKKTLHSQSKTSSTLETSGVMGCSLYPSIRQKQKRKQQYINSSVGEYVPEVIDIILFVYLEKAIRKCTDSTLFKILRMKIVG